MKDVKNDGFESFQWGTLLKRKWPKNSCVLVLD